jgi:hypothetical protein
MSDEDRPVDLYDEPVYPGDGKGMRADDQRMGAWASRWGRLAKDQALGKKVVLVYDANTIEAQAAPVPFFDFGGSNLDAEQIHIVIDSPRVVRIPFLSIEGQYEQNLSGEYSSFEIGAGNFPGTAAPIIWPPFSCLIEWGTNAKTRAIVDVINGAKINISASWVRAFPLITVDAARNQRGTSGAYVLNAFASPGYSSNGNARRTVFLGTVQPAATSGVFVVPPFAKRATVNNCVPGGAPTSAILQFWQSPDGTHCVGNEFANAPAVGPFDVPNGAAYFSVFSDMGVAAPFNVVFELALS